MVTSSLVNTTVGFLPLRILLLLCSPYFHGVSIDLLTTRIVYWLGDRLTFLYWHGSELPFKGLSRNRIDRIIIIIVIRIHIRLVSWMHIDFVKLTPLQKVVSCFLNASVEGKTIPFMKVLSLNSIWVVQVTKHVI